MKTLIPIPQNQETIEQVTAILLIEADKVPGHLRRQWLLERGVRIIGVLEPIDPSPIFGEG